MSTKCPICYDDIQKNNLTKLPCSHTFHFNCIMELYNQSQPYNNKCPLCRTQFTKQRDVIQKLFNTSEIIINNYNHLQTQYDYVSNIKNILIGALIITMASMVIGTQYTYYNYIIDVYFHVFNMFTIYTFSILVFFLFTFLNLHYDFIPIYV